MIRASSLHRYRSCPGAPAAERGIPQREEKEWTRDGTTVHRALEGAGAVQVPPHLVEVVDWMNISKEYLLDKVFPATEGVTREEVVKERQMFVTHKGRQIISGHPDFIQLGTIWGKRVALILDFKAGFLDVPAPEANDQLRAYAVMVWQELKVHEVFAAIIPRFGIAKAPVFYTHQDLPEALEDLAEVELAGNDAKARRIPSVEACRYCNARATSSCPETLKPDKRLTEMPSLINLTPAEKGALLNLCEIVAGNIKMLKDRLYDELAENPEAVEGWLLAPGDFRSSIPDAARAYERVQDLMTPEEFQACLSVKMGDFKEEIKGKLRDKEGIKGKVLSSRLENVLEPMIVRKQGDPKLERKE
jgi:hypothetical protein